MIEPTPLYFQVPMDELERLMRANSAQLGPDFLCFETFYQAVAASWPRDYTIIDVGGFTGVQGWLFRDFRRYVCVDRCEVDLHIPGIESMSRCKLPGNGYHVVAEGNEYLRQFLSFDVNISHDLFVCSAVPNENLRKMVRRLPNFVEWYPSEPMRARGEGAAATKRAFRELDRSGWRDEADRLIWEAEKSQVRTS